MFFSRLAIAAAFFVVIDGSEKIKTRISAGEVTSISQHPYIVSIKKRNQQWCGGSIISKNIIVTAAHCIPTNWRNLYVNAGSSFSAINGSSVHNVKSLIKHEKYKMTFYPSGGSTAVNDIAIIKVEPSFEFDGNIAPISMFDADEKITQGMYGTVSGWGFVPFNEKQNSTSEDKLNNQLRSVDVPVFNKTVCAMKHARTKIKLSPGQICAGRNGKGGCGGDSGGPLVVNGKLAGIVSWGYGCGLATVPPPVYTEVAYFRKWIDRSMKRLAQSDNDNGNHNGFDYFDERPIW